MVAIEYVEGCTGKQAYESQGQAAQAGRKIGKRSKSKLHAYRCKHCHLWHLTSLEPEKHRRYRDRRAHADPCDLRTPASKVLDVSDHRLAELDHRVRMLEERVAHLTRTLERYEAMALNLSQLIVDLNDNTNAVAARLDKLAADLAAAQGGAVTDAQLEELQAIAGHLKAMGTDPNNPIPSPPPVVTDATTATANANANAAAAVVARDLGTPPADSGAAPSSTPPAGGGSDANAPASDPAPTGSGSTSST